MRTSFENGKNGQYEENLDESAYDSGSKNKNEYSGADKQNINREGYQKLRERYSRLYSELDTYDIPYLTDGKFVLPIGMTPDDFNIDEEPIENDNSNYIGNGYSFSGYHNYWGFAFKDISYTVSTFNPIINDLPEGDDMDSYIVNYYVDNERFKTNEGIGVGSTKQDMMQAYGEEYSVEYSDDYEEYIYIDHTEHTGITFYIKDGMVEKYEIYFTDR